MGASAVTDPGAGSGGDTGGLFGDQPGASDEGIPIEGESSDPAGNKEPPPPTPKVIKPVEITKGADLGTCVIGEACEKKISAKGGSGEYVWTLVEGALPKGLELTDTTTQKAKVKKIEGQEIDEVGDFAFTLKVEDAADAARSAERKFTLRVNEDIAMALFAMGKTDDGSPVWTAVQEKDANGDPVPITIPPKGILLVEVIGHATSYKWSINGQEITCNDQTCTGTKDGLTLYKDTSLSPPEPRTEHFAYMILKAEEDFIGQEVKNVVIAAAQDYGDPVSKTISSITFQQEPCKIPLAVTGGSVTAKPGESYTTSFAVIGGLAPYFWKEKDNGDWQPAGEGAFTVEGTVAGGETVTLKQLKEGMKRERAIDVKDSCSAPQMADAVLTISVPFDDSLIDDVSDIRIQTEFQDVNDTSSDGTTWLEIRFWSKGVQLGKVHYDLDPCGDNGDDAGTGCEGTYAIKEAKSGKITDIDDIEVHFYDEDCFLCDYLDCDIIKVTITTDNWKAIYDDENNNGDKFNDDVCDGDEHCGSYVTDKMSGYQPGTNGTWNIWQYVGG